MSDSLGEQSGNEQKSAVIVTGGGSGIGYELVRLALAAGYGVGAFDVVPGKLAALAHPDLVRCDLDVRDAAALHDSVAAVAARGWRIAGLATCAAVFRRLPFLDMDEALWDETIGINLTGGLLAIQAVLPHLHAGGGGSIVMYSSGLARVGAVGGAHYAATKGGVLGLARTLALEVAAENIRVNVVSPGITDTPQPRGHMSDADMVAHAGMVPLGRNGTAEEMAQAAMFLLGPDSSYMTGQDLRLNGGEFLF